MKRFNKEECKFIQDRASERIYEIFDALGIEYVTRQDYLQCACPVHGGDNPRGLYWAMQTAHWKCVTRQCEQDIITGPSSSIFGLVRGVLTNKTEKKISFQQSVDFVAKTLGLAKIKMDEETEETIEINKAIKKYRKKLSNEKNHGGQLLSEVLEGLKPDAEYYPGRGVSSDIINRYHISFCDNPKKPFYKRAFFPILDDTGKYVVGWSARSIFDKCKKCKMYHDPEEECPENKDFRYVKWRHSFKFKAGECLYNYWLAKTSISKHGTAIICEGPGDVWALEQAGIKNSVALFGLSFSKKHRQLLQKAGALTLVFMLDNDKAGEKAEKRLQKQLMYYFRLFFLTQSTLNDIGDMVGEEIKDKILPFMQKISMKKTLGSKK
jgi:5S rRNA maturation endonuclease (ribonuclease M5)